jgi:pimeloyl-ACP methyl ester carboxylesterase
MARLNQLVRLSVFLNMQCLLTRCFVAAVVFSILPMSICGDGSNTTADPIDPYLGIYSSGDNDFVSIAKFDLGDGQNRLLFTDFKSGVIRILSPNSGNTYSAGAGLLMNPPVEMEISFGKNNANEFTNLVWQQDGSRRIANRVNRRMQAVSFQNGEMTLSGTLITPGTTGLHPAVVFLHGSGALNRYSFGPFPDFFLSRGFAVLVYDKRGTGSSKGNLEQSTFDDLASDARAAIEFLKSQQGIDPNQIGLCGASQGGFLAALVAAGNRDVAFIVNLYGMYVPAWQQELYRTEAEMRVDGLSEAEISEGLDFIKLEFNVGRTGQGWEKVASVMEKDKKKKWLAYVPKSSSLVELRKYWETDYSYDPSVALERVSCPVLALFGELDKSTPVSQTIANMQRALKIAGNTRFTYKVFPKGNHGLLESETGSNREIPKLKRFVPGLFDTITVWLQKRPLK